MSTSSQNPTTPSSPGLSPEREQEYRTLAEAATPGPWLTLDDQPSLTRLVRSDDYTLVVSLGYVGNRTQNDAEFIAAARTAVPALLAEVDRLRAELAVLESAAFGDAKVRLFTPVDQIRHLHTALARQMARAETVNRIATEQRERAEQARTAALNEAVEAARSEYLHDETGTPEDEAYNQGVTDAIAAIGALTEGGAR